MSRSPTATANEPARWLVKPVVLARLIQAAEPDPQDRVLVVGAGTGYAAAVLARLAGAVVALEQNVALVAAGAGDPPGAWRRQCHGGGWPAGRRRAGSGPYDLILIDGGVETVPESLFGQMSSRGRLVAVVAAGPVGKATLFQTVNGETGGRVLVRCDGSGAARLREGARVRLLIRGAPGPDRWRVARHAPAAR